MNQNALEKKKILLVGLGRMGQRYLEFLTSKFPGSEIFVIDNQVKQKLFKNFSLKQINDLQSLEQDGLNFDLIIDAATTDGRLKRLNLYKKIGKQVFLEKPAFAFHQDVEAASLLTDNELTDRVAVNYPWYYSRFHRFIRSITKRKFLGELISVNFNCGAVGWSNIGGHNLAIFKHVTGNFPSISHAYLLKQNGNNPRGSEYIDFDGLVSGKTKSGVSFTHSSSVDCGIGVIENYNFENGYVLFDRVSGHFTLARRPNALKPHPTQYGRYKSVTQGKVKEINIQDLLEDHLLAFLYQREHFTFCDATQVALLISDAIRLSARSLGNLDGYKVV